MPTITPDDRLLDVFTEPGAYYTSYPALAHWRERPSSEDFARALASCRATKAGGEISLYLHFPFCPKLCLYCICNTQVTHDRGRVETFLDHLHREIDQVFDTLKARGVDYKVSEIHLGGGSPSWLPLTDLGALLDRLGRHLPIGQAQEVVIEVDPRTVDVDKLLAYSELGINRLSFGVQEFNPAVQEAINRVQPPEMVAALLTPEVRRRFPSINFDLLYGLPLQTKESFLTTLEVVDRLAPDRITLLKYAHVPALRPHQAALDKHPRPDERQAALMFFAIVERLKAAGWVHVGIDHFARPGDELALADREHRLQRTFNGFSPRRAEHILGLGPSSTSQLAGAYFQNHCELPDYYDAVARGQFPVASAYTPSRDDLLRREVINSLLCDYGLDFQTMGSRHQVDFQQYFAPELARLNRLVGLDLARPTLQGLDLNGMGRMFVRHFCKVFDKFLPPDQRYEIHGP